MLPSLRALGSGSNQKGGHIGITVFENTYCTGAPVNWETQWRGQYWAQPKGKGFYYLGSPPKRIFSYRLTWTPADGPPINQPASKQQQAGVKLVLWPLYDMDKQIGTIDEFTCEPNWKYQLGSLPGKQGQLGCASPVDRIYCMEYDSPDNFQLGVIDPLTPVDFAGNTDIPREYGFR